MKLASSFDTLLVVFVAVICVAALGGFAMAFFG